MNQITEIIRKRRSIYPGSYSGEKVEDYIIEEMLENANWAPTHKLTQPWRFVVFTGEGLKKLADKQSALYKKVALAKGTYSEKTFEKLQNKPLMASHVIAILMKRDPKESVPEEEEIASVAAAVQNMYLTAAHHGIGCYWGSGGITYFEEAKPLFSLEPKDKLLGFFYVGKPRGAWPEGKRDNISEKVEWIRS